MSTYSNRSQICTERANEFAESGASLPTVFRSYSVSTNTQKNGSTAFNISQIVWFVFLPNTRIASNRSG